MPRKIVNTKKISHDEWVSLRKKSIGGSDAGALVGMNPWSSALTVYADKKGLSKEKETSEAMRLGTDLENYVAQRFCEQTGKKVINDLHMYADDEHDFITANIDRKVVGEKAGLECKVMGSFAGYDVAGGEYPAQYYAQVQHYMMVMGWDMMYLGILVLQRGFFLIEIPRDDSFIKDLREAEIRFWTHYVEKDIMPDPDGSEASLDTLKEIFPEAQKNTEIAIPGLDALIRDYKAYSELESEYKEKKSKVQAQICAKLGDNEVGVGNDYGCSWKSQSKTSIDTKRLKADMPQVYAKYAKTSDYRVFRTRNLTK